MSFQRVIVVDWSAASRPHPTPRKDAVWIGLTDGVTETQEFHPTRASAETRLQALVAEGRRDLIGFDFPLGAPLGLAHRLTGEETAPALWAWLAARITDGPKNANNRFQVAAEMNRILGAQAFWGRPATWDIPDVPTRKLCDYKELGLNEHRACEKAWPGTQPFWKLLGAGSVGSQALMGLPVIHRLSQLPGVTAWPWDATGRVVLAEVWPSVLAPAVRAEADPIPDRAQVRLLARALRAMGALPPAPRDAEGWILTPRPP